MRTLTDGERDVLREQDRDAEGGDGAGLLDTADDYWSAGFSWGLDGWSAEEMVAAARREVGDLPPWAERALRDGNEAGRVDRVRHAADVAARVDAPALSPDDIPF